MADSVHETPPGPAAVAPADTSGSAAQGAAAGTGEAVGTGETVRGVPWTVRGAFVAGLTVQVLFWTLVFLGIVTAVAVGGHLTEFRYVGF